jgi:hypothetical protein
MISKNDYENALKTIEMYELQEEKPFKKQLDFLRGKNIKAEVFDGKVLINGNVEFYETKIERGVFKNLYIEGNLEMRFLTNAPSDFLENSIITGRVLFNRLSKPPKNFLKNTVILNGGMSRFNRTFGNFFHDDCCVCLNKVVKDNFVKWVMASFPNRHGEILSDLNIKIKK